MLSQSQGRGRLAAYAWYYGLTRKQRGTLAKFLEQFGACRSDEARRLLLGRSA